MASNNDENVDLGLSLGSTNYIVETRLDDNTGAGVNAASIIEMGFASSNPVSELVWSPNSGLSLKCADSSSADHKPFLMWNVRPSINDVTMCQSIRSKRCEDENVADGEKLIVMPKNLNGNSRFGEHIADISENSKKHAAGDIVADESKVDEAINSRVEINASTSDVISLAIPVQSEPFVCSLPNSQCRQDSDDEATSASGKMSNNNKTMMPIPISGPILTKLEPGSENDSDNTASKEANDSNSRIHSYREKGKGKKAFSNEDISEGSSNESCNRVGFFSKGVKRRRNEEPIGSKRTKMQIQESCVSRRDSSFMNWISNMVKGYKSDCDNKVESSSSLALVRPGNKTRNNKSPNTGFHAMFQSLYSSNTKKDCTFAIEGSKELTVADEDLSENVRRSCERKNEDSSKQIILSKRDVNPIHISRKIAGPSDCSCKQVNSTGNTNIFDNLLEKRCMPEKSNKTVSSLWITRLYTKTAELENCDQEITEEAHYCSAISPKANLDKRITGVSSTDPKISKARENRKSPMCENIVCFFCRKCDHDLRKCPELTEAELEDLLVKLRSFDAIGDSSSKRLSIINEFRKSTSSNSEYGLDGKRKISLRDFVDRAQNAEETFRAIRKLRLSRDDIHRWMNSNVSLSHLNGFFVRLKLRKFEAGLEGTGYYVARITDMVENINYDSKKSMLVDVGGIKSSVGSEYISNNDFLEDEIKDWWSRIVKAGGKIPSLDELKSKVEYRTFLGV